MPVLDVRHTADVIKPRRELDPVGHVAGGRLPSERDERRSELLLHGVPVEIDVVIAVHDRERVACGDERGELLEHVPVPRDRGAKLHPRVIGRVAQAVLAFLVAGLRVELAVTRQQGHPDEVDEVPCDDQAPASTFARSPPVVGEQVHEVRIDALRPLYAAGQLVEITPQMHIREDQQALAGTRNVHT